MLWVVVVLKDEVPQKPEGFVPIFNSNIIPSTLTKAPVPAEEKQPQSVMLPPPCFTVGMVFLW